MPVTNSCGPHRVTPDWFRDETHSVWPLNFRDEVRPGRVARVGFHRVCNTVWTARPLRVEEFADPHVSDKTLPP